VTFDETLTRVLELLQRDGRVSYRALKRRFALDEDYLDDLKAEIIQAKRLAVDEDGAVLVWTGGAIPAPVSASAPARAPLTYTPAHLAEKIRAARPALEGERKQVTVLFADLKGSTELIAGLDPEAAQTLLDPALHVMMDAVHRYEGTVNQVLGDGIMALFGVPVAHEDHAVRACYAALAMQAAPVRRRGAARPWPRAPDAGGSQCWRSRRPGDWQRSPYGLLSSGSDDASGGPHGAARPARRGPDHPGGASAGRRLRAGQAVGPDADQGPARPARGL